MAILFDWDGTLLDSYAAGFGASMAVFRHFEIPVDRERFLSTYSPNWYISYRQLGLPESIGVESPFGTRELLEEASPDLILPDAGHLSGRFGPR